MGVLRDDPRTGALDGIPTPHGASPGIPPGTSTSSTAVDHLPHGPRLRAADDFLVLLASFRAPVSPCLDRPQPALGRGVLWPAGAGFPAHLGREPLGSAPTVDHLVAAALRLRDPLRALDGLHGPRCEPHREAIESGSSAHEAVRIGIIRTAGVVTSAAVDHGGGVRHLRTLTCWSSSSSASDWRLRSSRRDGRRAVLLPAALALLGDRAVAGWSGRSVQRQERRKVCPFPARATFPSASASDQETRPVARFSQVTGSVSMTAGGVPLVCRGPAMACTAA